MTFSTPTTTPRGPVIRKRIPGRAGRPTGGGKYPFDKLEVGQSFFIPEDLVPAAGARGVLDMARRWASRRGLRFHPFSVKTFPMGVRVTREAVGDERGNRGRKYDFGGMEVGDTILVSRAELPARGLVSVEAAIWSWRYYEAGRVSHTFRTLRVKNGVAVTRVT